MMVCHEITSNRYTKFSIYSNLVSSQLGVSIGEF